MKKSILFFATLIFAIVNTNARTSIFANPDFTDNFAIKVSEGPAYLYGDIGVQAGKEPLSQVINWYSNNMSYMYSLGFQHFFQIILG